MCNKKILKFNDYKDFLLKNEPKSNLANLKTEVDKLDTGKLTPVPNDLAKLSNGVKNDVVKKTKFNKLVSKVNNIDTIVFALKTTYDSDKSDLEKKISDFDKKNS